VSGDSGGAYTLQALITDSVETLHVNNFETDAATTAVDYTGSAGNDTFIMMTTADKIAGGAGTSDTLDVDYAAVLGGISVDLSATGEQISTLDGGAISGSVTGFENVDLSGYTGFGASVTAIKTGSTITGTGSIDRITGGASADTITGGDGADVLTGGAGNDTFVITALSDLTDGANAVEDTITGGTGTGDTLAFNGGVTLAAADDFTSKVTGVESITANGAQTGAISLTTHATFVSDTGIATIDLSADTSATGGNVIDISNQTTTTAMSIRGSAGVDTITLDAGSVDTVNVIGDVGGLTFATSDVINGFVSGTDKIKLVAGDATANTGNYVEVADADYDTFAAVLTAGNGALATLAGTSSATVLIAVVADATDADAGAVAKGAHVFIDTDGDGVADEMFILNGLAAATVAATDFIV